MKKLLFASLFTASLIMFSGFQTVQDTRRLKLDISIEEYFLVMKGLRKLPVEDVEILIDNIYNQAKKQLDTTKKK